MRVAHQGCRVALASPRVPPQIKHSKPLILFLHRAGRFGIGIARKELLSIRVSRPSSIYRDRVQFPETILNFQRPSLFQRPAILGREFKLRPLCLCPLRYSTRGSYFSSRLGCPCLRTRHFRTVANAHEGNCRNSGRYHLFRL